MLINQNKNILQESSSQMLLAIQNNKEHKTHTESDDDEQNNVYLTFEIPQHTVKLLRSKLNNEQLSKLNEIGILSLQLNDEPEIEVKAKYVEPPPMQPVLFLNVEATQQQKSQPVPFISSPNNIFILNSNTKAEPIQFSICNNNSNSNDGNFNINNSLNNSLNTTITTATTTKKRARKTISELTSSMSHVESANQFSSHPDILNERKQNNDTLLFLGADCLQNSSELNQSLNKKMSSVAKKCKTIGISKNANFSADVYKTTEESIPQAYIVSQVPPQQQSTVYQLQQQFRMPSPMLANLLSNNESNVKHQQLTINEIQLPTKKFSNYDLMNRMETSPTTSLMTNQQVAVGQLPVLTDNQLMKSEEYKQIYQMRQQLLAMQQQQQQNYINYQTSISPKRKQVAAVVEPSPKPKAKRVKKTISLEASNNNSNVSISADTWLQIPTTHEQQQQPQQTQQIIITNRPTLIQMDINSNVNTNNNNQGNNNQTVKISSGSMTSSLNSTTDSTLSSLSTPSTHMTLKLIDSNSSIDVSSNNTNSNNNNNKICNNISYNNFVSPTSLPVCSNYSNTINEFLSQNNNSNGTTYYLTSASPSASSIGVVSSFINNAEEIKS